MNKLNNTFKSVLDLGNKKITLYPYNTKMEKDILLMHSFNMFDLDSALHVLGVEEDLTENEKKAVLLKLRSLSVGDVVEIKFKCDHCGASQEGELELDNVVEIEEPPLDILKKYNTNISEITEDILDEMDIDDYDIVSKYIEDFKTGARFNFKKNVPCLSCRKDNKFDISDTEYILKCLSEDNLMSMYQNYSDMIFFGKFTKQDIDTLYPFERTIFIGLINKTKEEINKNRS